MLPGRSTKEQGREGGEPDEGREEINIGSEIAQEWLRASRRRRVCRMMPSGPHKEQLGKGSSKFGTAHKSKTKKRRKKKSGKRRTRWQWDEEQKLEEMLERRRMEGNSLQLEVMQKALEFVVHERMSQGEEGKCTEEPKTLKIWSIEEMQGKPSSSLAVDTEEMRQWRGMSQEEMDQCWKNLAEEEVLDKYKVEESKCEESAQKQKIQNKKVGRRKIIKVGDWILLPGFCFFRCWLLTSLWDFASRILLSTPVVSGLPSPKSVAGILLVKLCRRPETPQVEGSMVDVLVNSSDSSSTSLVVITHSETVQETTEIPQLHGLFLVADVPVPVQRLRGASDSFIDKVMTV